MVAVHTICFTLTTADNNRVIAGREGAISVVLSVLTKHISSEAACNSACGALYNITVNTGDLLLFYVCVLLFKDNKCRASSLGYSAVVAAVFAAHPDLSRNFRFDFSN